MCVCVFVYISDGLTEDNGLVEIKCPYSAKDYTNINDAIIEKKVGYQI